MADVLSRAQRSLVMAAVRSSGNKNTELKLLSLFKLHGVTGWRRNQPIYGKPDFVFRKQKLAVFVDGCFWHSCRWHCRMPKSRREFWSSKISKNIDRDRKVNVFLRRRGWRVVRIWEHALEDPVRVVSRIQAALATVTDFEQSFARGQH
ncbi:MAG TPA: very short patch repair endonuclease [Verrucomicrobiae bacterium]|nr:very short patch repair endonuclease [Verrucomicrobiae bacterium]